MSRLTVLIAPTVAIPALRQQTDLHDARSFADTESVLTLDEIRRRPPARVAIDRTFALSLLGQAFLSESCEDVAFVYLHFENGTMAGAHVSWLDPYKVRRVTVVGDRRMAVFDDVSSDEKLRLFDRGASYQAVSERARGAEYGEFKAIIRDGDIVVPRLPASEPLKEQMREFVDCCLTGEEPETGGRAGLEIVAVLEAATKSMRQDGAPVELPSVFERA